MKSLVGEVFEQSMKLGFEASNNEAEYEVLINGLKMANIIRISSVKILTDLYLVMQQLNGGYEVREERMVQYVKKSHESLAIFKKFEIT